MISMNLNASEEVVFLVIYRFDNRTIMQYIPARFGLADISRKKLYKDRPNVYAVRNGPNDSVSRSADSPNSRTGMDISISLKIW